MVKIIGYILRENKQGETFVALELQGDLVMVQSQETGKFYATAKKATITSTFTEEQAHALVGKEMPGRIERIECEPYEYTDKETGEVLELSHRYEYLPEGVSTPITVVHKNMEV